MLLRTQKGLWAAAGLAATATEEVAAAAWEAMRLSKDEEGGVWKMASGRKEQRRAVCYAPAMAMELVQKP